MTIYWRRGLVYRLTRKFTFGTGVLFLGRIGVLW